MTTTYDAGRQNPLIATFPFAFDTGMVDNVYYPMVEVPVNAIVMRTWIAITTIFNSGTDDKFSIGDQETGASATGDYYAVLSADITAAGIVNGVMTGRKYTVGGTVGIVWNPSGTAATAGIGELFVEYILEGRATEVNP